jgi:RimJ/RimL family protein N-acetyltransferase/N-acetylglutamate synthase-like GNAT family acetyltransferase
VPFSEGIDAHMVEHPFHRCQVEVRGHTVAWMEIRPAEERDAPAVAAILRSADDARVVSAAGWLHGRTSAPERARLLQLVGEEGGEVIAAGAAGLNTMTSTPGAAWAFLTVTPAERRRGHGTALAEPLLAHLRSVDARKVTSFFRFTEEGERWANARGWTRALTGPLIAVDPRTVPEPSTPAGFRCVPMSSVDARAVFDAVREAALDEPSAVPNDDLRFDDFRREWEDPDIDLDASTVVLDGDRVVAFTFLHVVGDRGQHGFTGTLREYRGRGLATAAKRCALRAAAARGVTRVTTSNAESNAAMRAINRRLGFEPIGEHVILALEL